MAAVIYTAGFLVINVDSEAIPTLINGLTASMSIIVGFAGAFLGITFRDVPKKDTKTKKVYIYAMAALFIPLMFLWTTYFVLTTGLADLAVRYGLSSLILTIYLFILILVYTVKKVYREL